MTIFLITRAKYVTADSNDAGGSHFHINLPKGSFSPRTWLVTTTSYVVIMYVGRG